MFVLNTTKLFDNPLYYGTVYADGTLDIEGTNDNLTANIEVKHVKARSFYPYKRPKRLKSLSLFALQPQPQ